MKTIDEYLRHVEPLQNKELERVRKIIKEVAPDVEETISWGMPTFKYKGKNLIHFAAFKNHMSLFPGALRDEIKDKLEGYTLSKGTIQFTVEHPLQESIIKELVRSRVAGIDEA